MTLKNFILEWLNDTANDGDTNSGFKIMHGHIYIDKSVKILSYMKIDNNIFVRFRNDSKKAIRKIIPLIPKEYNIILCGRDLYPSGILMHYSDIANIFRYYIEGDFYDLFNDCERDIFGMVVDYVNYFDCEEDFLEMFKEQKLYRRRNVMTPPLIEKIIRGKALGWDFGGLDIYRGVHTKYKEELDIDNMQRRYRLEKLVKDLNLDLDLDLN